MIQKDFGMLRSATLILIIVAAGQVCFGDEWIDRAVSNESLHSESWLDMSLGITSIYQQNTHGGLSTNSGRGRFAVSYDLEFSADMEKLLGIEGGSLYIHAEGWSSDTQGVDPVSVGSMFGVNDDAISPRAGFVITELRYGQELLDGDLIFQIGKMDISLPGCFNSCFCPMSFDQNAYANDEAAQFSNSSMVNNPAIPIPDFGLGASVRYNPDEWWYISAAIADAESDRRETGFSTTFDGDSNFFYVVEGGVKSRLDSANGYLNGMWRFGVWNDAQPKERLDRPGKSERNDIGLYASCDQMLYKENADPEDTQGLGAFGRYGWADDKLNEITNFWSAGLQYQGLFDGRDDDVLAFGVAQGIFSDSAGSFTIDSETAYELYYSIAVSESVYLSPSIQYITHPGGDSGVDDAVIFGLRAQIAF